MQDEVIELAAPYNSELEEFKLTNDEHKFNCYMNAIIQVLWHVRTLRESITKYSMIEQSNRNHEPYQVLNCLQQLFAEAFEKQKKPIHDFPVLHGDRLRFELFKYYYGSKSEFDLFNKADSSELIQ